ncbi:MAG: ribonuclease P protein component [Candidatus Nealsonbacteria bacterium]|nr:ribonuclease P protein component [Candidatus Nealsonbacteria bacterium]
MLPKENRLKNKKDFEKVFKNGKGFKDGLLYVKFAGNNLKDSRFGFIVSTKVSKKAVVRNKIKRILRAALKSELKDIKKGVDAVIITSPGIEINDLNIKIEKLLEKAKLI